MKNTIIINNVYEVIRKICKAQKASCVTVIIVPIADDMCLVTIKDIRNANMQARLNEAITSSLCESLEFLKEYDHYLFYALAF